MNFSDWNRTPGDAEEVEERVRSGAMPPWFYLPMHPEAKLTPDEKKALIEGLQKVHEEFQKVDPVESWLRKSCSDTASSQAVILYNQDRLHRNATFPQ